MSKTLCCREMFSNFQDRICPVELSLDGKEQTDFPIGKIVRFTASDQILQENTIITFAYFFAGLLLGGLMGYMSIGFSPIVTIFAVLCPVLGGVIMACYKSHKLQVEATKPVLLD